MPEETSITLRYAIPGFSFIIVMLLASWRMVVDKISEAVPAGPAIAGPLFAAFLTFVGGIPTGFLVSQLYFVWFNFSGGYERRIVWRNLLRCGKDLRELKPPLPMINLPKESEVSELVIFDYLIHSPKNSARGIEAYTRRRWDLVFALKSTIVALVLGLIAGFLIVPLGLGLCFSQLPIFNPSSGNIVLIGGGIFFIIILWRAYGTPQSEITRMHEFLIRKSQRQIDLLTRS